MKDVCITGGVPYSRNARPAMSVLFAVLCLWYGCSCGSALADDYTQRVIGTVPSENRADYRLNNKGQVLYSYTYKYDNTTPSLIYLYSNGSGKSIDNPGTQAVQMQMNDQADVAWSDKANNIVMYHNGKSTVIVSNPNVHRDCQLSNNGKIFYSIQTETWRSPFYLYDVSSGTIDTITSDVNADCNWKPILNTLGDMVWSRSTYNCTEGRENLYIYHNGKTVEIQPQLMHGYAPAKFNASRQVLYTTLIESDPEGLSLWLYDGSTHKKIGSHVYAEGEGSATVNMDMNNSGQIVWVKENTAGKRETYLYSQGKTLRIFESPSDYTISDTLYPRINASGQVVCVAETRQSPSEHEILVYDSGRIRRVSGIVGSSYGQPGINDLGQVLYTYVDKYAVGIIERLVLASPSPVNLTPVNLLLLNP